MKVLVVDQEGVEHELEAIEGWRVMEIIRDWGHNIKAECGGAGACATCHVYVDSEWQDKLAAPSLEEEAMLDHAYDVADNSRLSCQILMSEELDGLKVTLAASSAKEDYEVPQKITA